MTATVPNLKDYSGLDLKKKDFSHGNYRECNFDGADMSEANCEGSDFTGSSFRKTNLYRVNFKDAKLGATIFEPDDCYGITLTLECRTFEQAQVSQLWFLSLLMLGTLTVPASGPIKEDLRQLVIGVIGAERYVKLKALFRGREF